MENLTKHQIILLTLLVSFVTSIATGIVTVSLMEQVPPSVTQTINRVVERTVERVVPDPNSQGASVITKEVTVVVNENDLITDSIASGAPSVVRIFEKNTSQALEKDILIGLGAIFSKDGLVVTSSEIIDADGVYDVVLSDGRRYEAAVHSVMDALSLLILNPGSESKEFKPALRPITPIGKDTLPKLGQTVIALGGGTRDVVAVGTLSSVIYEEDNTNASTTLSGGAQGTGGQRVISAIQADVAPSDELYGGLLITMFGEAIGIHTEKVGTTHLYTPLTTRSVSTNSEAKPATR